MLLGACRQLHVHFVFGVQCPQGHGHCTAFTCRDTRVEQQHSEAVLVQVATSVEHTFKQFFCAFWYVVDFGRCFFVRLEAAASLVAHSPLPLAAAAEPRLSVFGFAVVRRLRWCRSTLETAGSPGRDGHAFVFDIVCVLRCSWPAGAAFGSRLDPVVVARPPSLSFHLARCCCQ